MLLDKSDYSFISKCVFGHFASANQKPNMTVYTRRLATRAHCVFIIHDHGVLRVFDKYHDC